MSDLCFLDLDLCPSSPSLFRFFFSLSCVDLCFLCDFEGDCDEPIVSSINWAMDILNAEISWSQESNYLGIEFFRLRRLISSMRPLAPGNLAEVRM